MDWGLAKVLGTGAVTDGARADGAASGPVRVDPAAEYTEPGIVLGTPAYMPPEQAAAAPLNRRADVFGLGAILCEILTGAPPYVAQGREELYAKALAGDQGEMRARLAGCGAEAELVALAGDCLAPGAGDRPADARAVADRIGAYLDGVQERLRRSELERAAAQARARSEARARRLTAGLAAAVVALVALAGAAWAWRARQRAATSLLIGGELARAEQLGEQARRRILEHVDDAEGAVGLWSQAFAALDRADRLAASGPTDPALSARREARRREMQAGAADARLLADLDAARLNGVAWAEGGFDYRATLRGYEAALQAYGIDVRAGDATALARRLRRLPPAVKDQALLALEHWASRTSEDDLRGRLREASSEADPDEWRGRCRAAMAGKDVQALRRLAAEARQHPPSALGIYLLGLVLQALGANDETAALLRHAERTHPTDFWIHFSLANALRQGHEDGPLERAEAIGCYRAALALRPRSSVVYNNLGGALRKNEDVDGAIAAFRRAIELDPGLAPAHINLSFALTSRKDWPGAIAELREACRLEPKNAAAWHNLGYSINESGHPRGAIDAYRRAIELAPKDAGIYLEFASVLRVTDDLPGAVAALRRATELDPEDARAATST
jgi:serine/threonine-protein kinase